MCKLQACTVLIFIMAGPGEFEPGSDECTCSMCRPLQEGETREQLVLHAAAHLLERWKAVFLMHKQQFADMETEWETQNKPPTPQPPTPSTPSTDQQDTGRPPDAPPGDNNAHPQSQKIIMNKDRALEIFGFPNNELPIVFATVVKKWRQLSRMVHPDKFVTKPDAEKQEALKRFQVLGCAKDYIHSHFYDKDNKRKGK